ncbi:MAG: dTDP-4-dehydrorhamnose 3,5-epimerase [Kiritimatiellae bacterium]|nr:dTDP-4-dehydrorhamnose 3,5-epimerase [Kiritimatiellia bacterium]MDW8457848.1 dTDP-4-dehydrorhamnose 3,5-epimerase [Verrucomicrobiota bacterium]
MKVTPLEIPDVLLVEPVVFGDARGFFMETFHAARYRAAGIDRDFVQDNFSFSRRGIVRGLHYQLHKPQAKLVYVTDGEVLDVAVDIRRGSPTFGRWCARVLSSGNRCQMFIPEGFAHGFCVLSECASFQYKCSAFYDPADERGIAWNDPDIGITWPVEDPVLSERDRRLPRLRDVDPSDLPIYRSPAG